ncbi:YihY/virulence factor BrkB family protein [Amycolatopsis thermophila]|uniref:YihY family inner membrane protein n=1 Tax=Amycolatopsis thermophila TaxID=206084 RepID=A0ABU0EWQ2_9PSEU|nr:YihY/virulence factor BrkB family protein [Amycolatopsis thermophila]MDQ0379727.1 YihY family inner membrane protein [Amycolatopsis thermophila]
MSEQGRETVVSRARAGLERADAVQQEYKSLSVPVAVIRKFLEDQSTRMAAMIAFWAFFSIFPLFLVLITLLGFLVPDNVKGDVLGHLRSMLPLLDPSSIQGLGGSWWALILGLVTALWSGLAVVRATQTAFNAVWELPYHARPSLPRQIGRSVLVLATVGVGLVASTVVTGFVSSGTDLLHVSWLGRIAGYAIAIVLDIGLFVAAFRILTDREITLRDVLPGAVLSGVLFWIMQTLSSLIISRYLSSAQNTYGTFATVITLLWWFYLQAIVTLLGAQLNVVLKDRLHPRALVGPPETEADHRAYEAYAEERTYHEEERVDTEFPPERRR